MEKELTRATVDPKYTWDVTRIYASDEAWEKAFADTKAKGDEVAAMAGTLKNGKQAVLAALTMENDLEQALSCIYTYAMMKTNEEMTQSHYQAMLGRAGSLVSEVMAKGAFLTPELLSLDEETIKAYIADPDFSDYDARLEKTLRMKPHTLSAREEQLLAMAGEVCGASENTYDMLVGADMDLGMTRGEDGKKVKLTDVRLLSFLGSKDRAVRKAAYTNTMNGYAKLGNTIAAMYAGQVKADMLNSQARGYKSCREAALYPDEVSEEVYDSLIAAIHGGIGTLSEYLRIKKEQLGLSVMHLYDMYVDVDTGFDISMDVDEAFATFIEAVAPLGEDYQRDAGRALPERWIDAYETKNKRGGAYCTGGAYWTTPYVLLNHKKAYDGLSTLCHEMGHAMHSFYSNKTQPSAKADYTIFVAEVASTCNEILLSEYLLKKYADNREARAMLIGNLLEHFRTTVFRQTLFAEFEHEAHKAAEAGQTLTKDVLCKIHYDLNKLYYGKACKVDKEVQYEWMRIPHFYSSFYVYKYATGFCAAVALARGILSGDKEKLDAYRKFLTLGGSMSPIEELKVAGVDMSTPEPVVSALDTFAELLADFSEMQQD